MYKYLEKLKEKPAHKKNQIAFGASLGITIMICAIWLSIKFYAPVGETSFAARDTASVSPFQGLKSAALDGLTSLQKKFDDVKAQFGAFSNSEEFRQASSTTDAIGTN